MEMTRRIAESANMIRRLPMKSMLNLGTCATPLLGSRGAPDVQLLRNAPERRRFGMTVSPRIMIIGRL